MEDKTIPSPGEDKAGVAGDELVQHGWVLQDWLQLLQPSLQFCVPPPQETEQAPQEVAPGWHGGDVGCGGPPAQQPLSLVQ